MTSVKGKIKEELLKATTWLSVSDMMDLVNHNYETVSRELRRLRNEGIAAKSKIPFDRFGRKQWASASSINLPNAKTPTRTVWVKTKHQNKKTTIAAALGNTTANTNTTLTTGDIIVQIEQGVEAIVDALIAAGTAFSAHDVTKKLREQANAGTVQIDPGLAGTVHVGGKDVTRIEHSVVRDVVHTLMTGAKYNAIPRTHTGTFFEYTPSLSNATPPAPSTPPIADGGSYDGNSTL